ncbi:MAG: acetylglutamate kinase [Terriglobia bacterium]
MKLVIKAGGQAMDDARVRRNVARQVASLRRSGHDVVVVHGGGKLLTSTLARLGIASEFSDGLRVTGSEARDVALMVLAGFANKQWVAAIRAQGVEALGVCGGDAGLVEARKLAPSKGREEKALGFVGRPAKVNTALLDAAFERDWVPVVASVAPGPRNEYFNVNADDFAAALATGLRAERLIYLTESGGVWDAEHRRLPLIRVNEIQSLIRTGAVRDGMIPKLLSCARVLAGRVGEIDMISPAIPEGVLQALSRRPHTGTRIVKDSGK